MKYLEIELDNEAPVRIPTRDTDTAAAWLRDNVTNNPKSTVLLGTTSFLKRKIRSVREVSARKGSTNMVGVSGGLQR